MNEQTPGTSGNRWEPTDQHGQPTGEPTGEPTDQPTDQQDAAPYVAPYVPSYDVAAPAPVRQGWSTRSRVALAGVAAAVLVAGGLGGIAIGQATAGGEDHVRLDQQGGPAGFDDDGGDRFGPPPGGQVPGSDGLDDEGQSSSGSDHQDS